MAYSKEVREEVLERIKNGESTIKISKETGIAIRTIHSWIHSIEGNEQTHKKSKSIRTPEEFRKNESIKRMLEYIKQGKSDSEIAQMPDIEFSKATVYNYKNKCIELGLITREEIENVKKEKREQKKSTNLKENDQNQKILEYYKKGLRASEISRMSDINLSQSQISRYRKIFIQEGLITQEELPKKKQKTKKEPTKEKKEQPQIKKDKQIKKILEYLKEGYTVNEINEQEDITISMPTIYEYIKKCIQKGLITQEEIDKSREQRKTQKQIEKFKENKQAQKILEYLKQGMQNTEIEAMSDITYKKETIAIYKRKLIEYGLITQEQIDKSIEQRKNQKQTEKFKENEQAQKILEYLKQGMQKSEIEAMPDITYKKGTILNYKRKFIEKGLITQEQIDKAIEERKIKQKQQKSKQQKSKQQKPKQEKPKQQKPKEQKPKEQKPKQQKPKQQKPKQQKPKQQKPKQEKPKQQKPKQQKPKQTKTTTKENKILNQEKTEELLSYLKEGYNPEIIKIYMKIDNKTYEETLKQLIKEKKITTETMTEKQKQKETEYKIRIYLKNIREHISTGEYSKCIKILQQATTTNIAGITEEEKAKLQKALNILKKAEKVKKAENAIKEGTQNTETLTKLTGLTQEEINFLKLKLSPEKSKISGISRREKILNLLASGNQSETLQKTLQICDFEMDDILDQYKYRIKKPETRNEEDQIKQDSNIRLSAILTKLGKNTKSIAQILKMQPEQVRENIKLALKTKIIKPDQLKGIKLLKLNEIALEEIERE